ncbi:alpha/beta hydrolase [Promicromonospora sp. NPDC052451]|uniref:alpha/beta hydrolase n=1 Tax=Promicromonospora sp. NPDC052451 TaxID=3364407 RepID=UPI0037CB4AEE
MTVGTTAGAGQPVRLTWAARTVAAGGLAVVAWACLTAGGAVLHGHPAYAVLLTLTVLGCALVLVRGLRSRPARTGRAVVPGGAPGVVVRAALLLVGVVWIAAVAWLRPFAATAPALAAMADDDRVTVTESATRVVLAPAGDADGTAVFFRPGAKVEARAYAAVLRPLAEAGHPVVIAKQPFAVAFLAGGAFDDARAHVPGADRWVVGGHSLGGVVASSDADDADKADGTAAPVVGLLLYASYPAQDLSGSLTAAVESVSASRDGLATPAKIDASRANLPPGSTFTVVDGAVHAFFGDHGPQPGDGTPAITHDQARTRISAASTRFVDDLSDHRTTTAHDAAG